MWYQRSPWWSLFTSIFRQMAIAQFRQTFFLQIKQDKWLIELLFRTLEIFFRRKTLSVFGIRHLLLEGYISHLSTCLNFFESLPQNRHQLDSPVETKPSLGIDSDSSSKLASTADRKEEDMGFLVIHMMKNVLMYAKNRQWRLLHKIHRYLVKIRQKNHSNEWY